MIQYFKKEANMFIGRKQELSILNDIYNKKGFEFGIIHGRRRVGKTSLLRESIKDRQAIYFLAQQANEFTNLELFSKTYGAFKGVGEVLYKSFNELFSEIFKEDNLIVIIDEFTYLREVNKSFESMLQGLIDVNKDTSSIKLIISGSEVGMFENIFSHSKPLFNRQTFQIHLKECDYLESSLYYQNFNNLDKIRLYSIFGGLPFYLSKIDDQKSLLENVINLIIKENAQFAFETQMLLVTELRSIQEYQSILQAIHSGSTNLALIDSKSGINNTAKTSKYVNKLIELEIIKKEYRFKDSPTSKKCLYKIKNNFFAFYYRFIWKNENSRVIMNPNDFFDFFIKKYLDDFISVRFEDICQQYLIKNFKSRHQTPLISIGRYWYNDRVLKIDVEIDACAETINHVFAYECKWAKAPINANIMDNLKSKSAIIGASKFGAFSKSGFSEEIIEAGDDLITIDDLFK